MVTRREFLVTSAGMAAACAGSAVSLSGQVKMPSAGAVYGRTGKGGISAGTSVTPSQGEVFLVDGTSLKAAHMSEPIRAGRSVLLSPDTGGGWTVLYAEF
jgi:hypothetical protein